MNTNRKRLHKKKPDNGKFKPTSVLPKVISDGRAAGRSAFQEQLSNMEWDLGELRTNLRIARRFASQRSTMGLVADRLNEAEWHAQAVQQAIQMLPAV